jgi:AraC-like DNA-binding protein
MRIVLRRLIALATRRTPDPARACLWTLEFLRLALEGAARTTERPNGDSWRAKIRSYIDRNLESVPRVSAMARHMGLSPTGFNQHFRREFGMTPARYVAALKGERAARILRQRPDLTITRVAMDLGFSSSRHFSAAFRRVFRISPTGFRQRKRPG